MEFISSNEGVTINLSTKLLSMINNVVSRATCGFKCNDQDEFMLVIACRNQKEILYHAMITMSVCRGVVVVILVVIS
jgi:hypothetical protein